MDIEQQPPPPLTSIVITMQGKEAINIAADYRKTKLLSVKKNPSSNKEDTSSKAKISGKNDDQTSLNPPTPPADGRTNSQLG